MFIKCLLRVKELWQRIKPTLLIEGTVVLTALATFAGAVSFLNIVQRFWDLRFDNWWLLALVTTLSVLPNVFNRIRRIKAPALIKAATAFREGFFALPAFAPNLPHWIAKIKTILHSVKGS